MSAVTAMNYRIRVITRHYLNAGATTPENALSLSEAGYGSGWIYRRALHRLKSKGILRPVSGDTYYMDLDAWQRYRKSAWIALAIVGGVMILWMAVQWLFWWL